MTVSGLSNGEAFTKGLGSPGLTSPPFLLSMAFRKEVGDFGDIRGEGRDEVMDMLLKVYC